MGQVCASGMGEKNKNNAEVVEKKKALGYAWKLNIKKKSSVSKKGDSDYSSSRAINDKKRKKKKEFGFSSEFKMLNPSAARGGKQASSQRGSFLGRAGERAVDVLDTLGSNMMPKLSTSNGGLISFGMAPRGHKISILAFEVANTINKGAILFQSLSEENIELLKKEILQSEGVQQLVSTDIKELISLVEADKRDEFGAFSKEVVRFGNMCKDNQWHNLDRYFSGLNLDILGHKQPRVDAEKTMQELVILSQTTAELYHELTAFNRFEQDYQIKVKEMESLNLPLKGESLTILQSELKQQKRIVKSLLKKSLWSRNLEEIVEKLVDIVIYMHQSISKFLGNHGTTSDVRCTNGSQRLGEAGLALHYANLINQINMISSRPSSLSSHVRDTLYQGLPRNIKNALQSKVQNNIDVTKEISMTQVKAEMDKILQWLTPLATNTTKAHQGFGWVGEWANGGNEFGVTPTKENNLIRLQTLHYAEKEKIDFYILELLEGLHNLVTFVRYKHNNLTKKPNPTRRNKNPKKGLDFQSRMLEFITLESDIEKQKGTEISQEDRDLLEDVLGRGRTPGVSKSENFTTLAKKKKESEESVLYSSKSVGNSPSKGFATLGMVMQNSHALDVMDGLTF